MVPGGPTFAASPPMEKLIEKGTPRGSASPAAHSEGSSYPQRSRIRPRKHWRQGRCTASDRVPPHRRGAVRGPGRLHDVPVAGIRRLTGKSTGLHRYGLKYGPEVRKQWQEWHTANKDYFYSPAEPRPYWGRSRVLVDVEAMIAGQTTAAHRKIHPRIKFDEIKTWTPDTGDERKLKELLFLDPARRDGQWSRYPVARFDSRPASLADAPLVGRKGRGCRCL